MGTEFLGFSSIWVLALHPLCWKPAHSLGWSHILDRWAALGERRRGGKDTPSATPKASKHGTSWRSGRNPGNVAADHTGSPWKINVREVENWRAGVGYGRAGNDHATRRVYVSEKVAHHDSGDDIVDLDWVCG